MSIIFGQTGITGENLNLQVENLTLDDIGGESVTLSGEAINVSQLTTDNADVESMSSSSTTVHRVAASSAQFGAVAGGASVETQHLHVKESPITVTGETVNFNGVDDYNGRGHSVHNVNFWQAGGSPSVEYLHSRKQAPMGLHIDENGKYWHPQVDGTLQDEYGQTPDLFLDSVDFRSADVSKLGLVLGHGVSVEATASDASNNLWKATKGANGLEFQTGSGQTIAGWGNHVIKLTNVGGVTHESKKFEMVMGHKATTGSPDGSGTSTWYMAGLMIKDASPAMRLHTKYGYHNYFEHILGFYNVANKSFKHYYTNSYPVGTLASGGLGGVIEMPDDSWVKMTFEVSLSGVVASIVKVDPSGGDVYGNEVGPILTINLAKPVPYATYCLGISPYRVFKDDRLRLLGARVM